MPATLNAFTRLFGTLEYKVESEASFELHTI